VTESAPREMQLVARRYARGELTGEELDRFEDYLMEHPELLDDIEAEGVLGQALQPNVVPMQPRTPASRGAPAGSPPWLAAACLLLALGVGYFTAGLQGPAPGAAISAELRLEPVRGGGAREIPGIAMGYGHTLVVLDVGVQDDDVDRLVVRRSNGDEVMRLSDLSVIDGYLQFAIADLDPGTYRVEVYPVSGDGVSTRYDFAVRSP